MKAVEQTLTRHSESKLEGTGRLEWDWIYLMGTRIMVNHRILEPGRILVTLLILQIRKLEAQKWEEETKPPSPSDLNFSLENLLVRGKLSCYNKESRKYSGLKI